MVADHLYACMGPQKTVAVKKSLLSTVRLFWIRAIKRVFTAKTPTIVDLYAIIYLALRHLNAAPFDVAAYLHMMKTNKVPFVNATLLLPPEMIQKMPLPTSYIMLTPVNVPLDHQFYRIVFRWTKILELALVLAPLADCFHYLAYTLFKALRIPQAPTLLLIYHELIWKMTNGVFREIKGPIIGPEVQSVVAMFFVVNLYFRSSPQIVDPRQFVNHVAVAVDERPYLKKQNAQNGRARGVQSLREGHPPVLRLGLRQRPPQQTQGPRGRRERCRTDGQKALQNISLRKERRTRVVALRRVSVAASAQPSLQD